MRCAHLGSAWCSCAAAAGISEQGTETISPNHLNYSITFLCWLLHPPSFFFRSTPCPQNDQCPPDRAAGCALRKQRSPRLGKDQKTNGPVSGVSRRPRSGRRNRFVKMLITNLTCKVIFFLFIIAPIFSLVLAQVALNNEENCLIGNLQANENVPIHTNNLIKLVLWFDF